MAARPLRIGAGAGFADDRIEPAVALAASGAVDYLVFECLAERTTARENPARRKDPARGYTHRLLERLEAVLSPCLERGVRIGPNLGAAKPRDVGRGSRRGRGGHD